jgi:hypothetical protein
MSLMDSELQQGLTELESDQSDSGTSPQITVGGLVWPCVRGSKKVGKQFQTSGGFTYDYDFQIHIRKNAVSSDGSTVFSSVTLASGDEVTESSTVYRVSFVDTSQGAYVALFLKDPNV